MEKQVGSSLSNFAAWWEIARGSAEDAIARYEDGAIRLLRDGEDISHRAIRELRIISENMDAMASAESIKRHVGPSLSNLIAWWEIARDTADDAIARYEDGTIRLLHDGEDISHRAIRKLRIISENMDALVSLAKRDLGNIQ